MDSVVASALELSDGLIAHGHKNMKKTITFGIPCYNSSNYMDHCIESILGGSDYADDVQIVISDGSVITAKAVRRSVINEATHKKQ